MTDFIEDAGNLKEQKKNIGIYINCTCGNIFKTKNLPIGDFYCPKCGKKYQRYYNHITESYEIF